MHFFVAKLLSVAVITYINIRHLRPTNESADLLNTQRINFSYAKVHVTAARALTRLISPFYRELLGISA